MAFNMFSLYLLDHFTFDLWRNFFSLSVMFLKQLYICLKKINKNK